MTCSSCGVENRDRAKFCLGCGQGLAPVCSGCGAALPPTARFCDQCGTALQVSGSAARASSGDTEPVQAQTVLRALPRAPLAAPPEHGLTALVGRQTEVAALETLFTHARADRARLNGALGDALVWAHEFDAALAAAQEAAVVADSCGEEKVTGEANLTRGFVAMCRGQLETAAGHFDAAARSGQATQNLLLQRKAQLYHALRANWRGEYRDAIEEYEALLPSLRSANELLTLAEGYSHLAIALGGAGEYARVLDVLSDGITLTRSIGDKVWRARLWNTRGWILGELGAYEAANEANRRCLEVMKELGSMRFASEFVGNATINLADAALWQGDLPGTEPHLAAVAAILADRRNEWMTWRYGMHYDLTAAEFWITRRDLGRARRHIENALAVAQRTRSRRYVVRATRLFAACHVAAGALVEGERLLAEVVSQAGKLTNAAQLWHALLAHGRVLQALGRGDEAGIEARKGLEAVNRVASTLTPELQAAFRGSTVYTGLEELAH
jgi:tetratricopeptide (TPR) repeat protein